MNAPLSTDRLGSATELDRLFALQREACAREPYPALEVRRRRVERIRELVVAHEAALCAAVAQDFGHRSQHETRLAELYIVVNGGSLVSPVQGVQILGIIVVSVFSAAGLLGLLSSFIATQSAFSGASIAIGAAIGFLVGAYIPIGSLPDGVQKVLTFFPSSHAARALRVVMMDDPDHARTRRPGCLRVAGQVGPREDVHDAAIEEAP